MNNMITKIPLLMVVLAFAFVTVADAEAIWVKDQNGCKIWWNDGTNLKTFKAVHWTGSCRKGYGAGRGVAIYKKLDGTQDIYKGRFKRGKIHGYGKIKWGSGTQYVGMFKHDKLHGKGVITWSNGKTYKGTWKNNYINGRGVMTWSNGKKYIGTFRKGEYYTGVVTFADGSTLEYIKGTADVTGNAMKLIGATNKGYSNFLLMSRMHLDDE